jgi:hypothetical protein
MWHFFSPDFFSLSYVAFNSYSYDVSTFMNRALMATMTVLKDMKIARSREKAKSLPTAANQSTKVSTPAVSATTVS